MKAVVATKYGGPDAIAIVDRPVPDVGPRDVLIAVRAASLNPLDAKIRAGKTKLILLYPRTSDADAGRTHVRRARP